ncbi:MAG: TIGR04282 family arsenosugar biosynthesis glycosyltransferase [Longimonas sp.]|uniref:TIGR04282 family arsenosugar biosynthesis glycosyltransferase n=1 Tax=Longimonas sp. TaxID=2039626 RepID=UPI003348F9C0
MRNALLVFAKWPRPGRVKTRLTPVLTDEEAAALYRAFLLDLLEQTQALHADVLIHWAAPVPAGEDPEPFATRADGMRVQKGNALGARMQHGIQDALSDGYERVAVVGSDHPTLPTAFLREAFSALARPNSITLGPSYDGGFYLIGMNACYPQVFADMRYSHPQVLNQTLTRIGQTSARLTVLPRWYDVDTPAALRLMLADMDNGQPSTRHTEAAVETLGLRSLV